MSMTAQYDGIKNNGHIYFTAGDERILVVKELGRKAGRTHLSLRRSCPPEGYAR